MAKFVSAVTTACVFCRKPFGKAGGVCGDGQEHCRWCLITRDRQADPCLMARQRAGAQMSHQFVAGHDFQRVPIT